MTVLASAIYTGRVRHRRMSPAAHAFSFPLFMMYLDLDEIDRVFGLTRLWSARSRWAPARFRREDYLRPTDRPLKDAVRDLVRERLGFTPAGPVRMLTHLRCFWHNFNPVTFYYCFDEPGERVEAIVAEITNTPWKERHAYALDARDAAPDAHARFRFDKAFHVSPFMPMEIAYDWAFSAPGEDVFVHMNLRSRPRGERTGGAANIADTEPKVFDATLTMERRPITPGALRMLLLRRPFMTLRVVAAIHWHALRLWLKRVPVSPHPRTLGGAAATEGRRA